MFQKIYTRYLVLVYVSICIGLKGDVGSKDMWHREKVATSRMKLEAAAR